MIRTRPRSSISVLLAAAVFFTAVTLRAQNSPSAPAQSSPATTAHRATRDKYCIGCHRGPTAFAGLHLDALDTANLETNGVTWEKLARKLRNREMPPAGMPRPDEGTYDALAWPKPGPIRDAARSIGSTERNTGTPFVICWRWRSMSRSCCRPTTSATA